MYEPFALSGIGSSDFEIAFCALLDWLTPLWDGEFPRWRHDCPWLPTLRRNCGGSGLPTSSMPMASCFSPTIIIACRRTAAPLRPASMAGPFDPIAVRET